MRRESARRRTHSRRLARGRGGGDPMPSSLRPADAAIDGVRTILPGPDRPADRRAGEATRRGRRSKYCPRPRSAWSSGSARGRHARVVAEARAPTAQTGVGAAAGDPQYGWSSRRRLESPNRHRYPDVATGEGVADGRDPTRPSRSRAPTAERNQDTDVRPASPENGRAEGTRRVCVRIVDPIRDQVRKSAHAAPRAARHPDALPGTYVPVRSSPSPARTGLKGDGDRVARPGAGVAILSRKPEQRQRGIGGGGGRRADACGMRSTSGNRIRSRAPSTRSSARWVDRRAGEQRGRQLPVVGLGRTAGVRSRIVQLDGVVPARTSSRSAFIATEIVPA